MHFAIEKVHSFSRNESVKRLVDVVFSLCGLVVLLPFIIVLSAGVLLSSKGPVLYTQERVGYLRRKFRIYKFRSMYVGAELNGPLLTSANDQRITKWGRFMRKWKLDEIPQLWNVLVGDMSIVGPRPEREFFIKKLEALDHSYQQLLSVKPGLTSLGMIRFGYASNIHEMAQRIKFDLEYIEKRSLYLDLKIIGDTIKIIVAAKGK